VLLALDSNEKLFLIFFLSFLFVGRAFGLGLGSSTYVAGLSPFQV